MPSVKKRGFRIVKYTACLAALALCLNSAAPQTAFATGFIIGHGSNGGDDFASGADNKSASDDSFGNTTGNVTTNMTGTKLWSALPSGTAKTNFKDGSSSQVGAHGSHFNKGGGSANACFSGQQCAAIGGVAACGNCVNTGLR